MKLAVMQPYFFPYLGYFHLIHAADVFVFYNNVNFIKGGWIHRNKILVNDREHLFSVPLLNQSSFTKINETKINTSVLPIWKKKFLRTLEQSYRKAPFFEAGFQIVKSVLADNDQTIDSLAIRSIQSVCTYLGLEKRWIISSQEFSSLEVLDKTDRLFEMSKTLDCTTYINLSGGRKLYTKEDFDHQGITLQFIQSKAISYCQNSSQFLPNLSILDILMFNSKEEINTYLTAYELS